jgi:uncharacterized protein
MDSVTNNAINTYIDLVKKIEPVDMVVLYGLYARVTENKWSDIDIAVVTDKLDGNIIDFEFNLYKLRRYIDDRIEPIVFSGKKDKSGFLESILSYGKVMYKK